jgi:hypothetical protein
MKFIPPYCEEKENLSWQRPRARYSIVRRGLPRSVNQTIHTQTPPIKRTKGVQMVVLISKRRDECPPSSLCVESVNRPRLGGNRDEMGTFVPCLASIFFPQGVAGGKLSAAPRPAARQAIDIVVELTWGVRARFSASAQRCGATATSSDEEESRGGTSIAP